MDKNCGNLVNSTVFQLPSKMGKGILVTPTVHGNLLVGPTAEDIPDKEDVDTTAEGLTKVLNLGSNSVDALDGRQTITSFAGLRAHLVHEAPCLLYTSYVFVEQHSTSYNAAAWIQGFGGYLINENREPGLNLPQTVEAMEYHKQFVSYMPADGEYNTVTTLFTEGKAASTSGRCV